MCVYSVRDGPCCQLLRAHAPAQAGRQARWHVPLRAVPAASGGNAAGSRRPPARPSQRSGLTTGRPAGPRGARRRGARGSESIMRFGATRMAACARVGEGETDRRLRLVSARDAGRGPWRPAAAVNAVWCHAARQSCILLGLACMRAQLAALHAPAALWPQRANRHQWAGCMEWMDGWMGARVRGESRATRTRGLAFRCYPTSVFWPFYPAVCRDVSGGRDVPFSGEMLKGKPAGRFRASVTSRLIPCRKLRLQFLPSLFHVSITWWSSI